MKRKGSADATSICTCPVEAKVPLKHNSFYTSTLQTHSKNSFHIFRSKRLVAVQRTAGTGLFCHDGELAVVNAYFGQAALKP